MMRIHPPKAILWKSHFGYTVKVNEHVLPFDTTWSNATQLRDFINEMGIYTIDEKERVYGKR